MALSLKKFYEDKVPQLETTALANVVCDTYERILEQSIGVDDIKHGIKASGMPAWGKSMADDYIWGMVALLQQRGQIRHRQGSETHVLAA